MGQKLFNETFFKNWSHCL